MPPIPVLRAPCDRLCALHSQAPSPHRHALQQKACCSRQGQRLPWHVWHPHPLARLSTPHRIFFWHGPCSRPESPAALRLLPYGILHSRLSADSHGIPQEMLSGFLRFWRADIHKGQWAASRHSLRFGIATCSSRCLHRAPVPLKPPVWSHLRG